MALGAYPREEPNSVVPTHHGLDFGDVLSKVKEGLLEGVVHIDEDEEAIEEARGGGAGATVENDEPPRGGVGRRVQSRARGGGGLWRARQVGEPGVDNNNAGLEWERNW
ncbi:hypothetical protein E2562_000003 [Oryza meyeriana var. granulata]|uniref:Uncharacterized protein n=1 Tax=Oryza meyeriana var. granulata TaxID=110450 RepID=A0A6G1DBV9_9ORYZ|nr:hypothetical protein E2562_000003 [Oryza meyeriana var. granulata]